MIAPKCNKCNGCICSFLSTNFELTEDGAYKSKKKRRGVSSGDDKNLYIYFTNKSTTIWWKENRGFEETIFDGRKLNTEELKNVLDYLDLKDVLNGK